MICSSTFYRFLNLVLRDIAIIQDGLEGIMSQRQLKGKRCSVVCINDLCYGGTGRSNVAFLNIGNLLFINFKRPKVNGSLQTHVKCP